MAAALRRSALAARDPTGYATRMQAPFGIAALLAFAWLVSERRAAIRGRTVLVGVALQWALAALLLHVPPARDAVLLLDHAAQALQRATDAGSTLLFGYLAAGPLPFVETRPGASIVLAFKILPLVLVISALSAALFHWGVLQRAAGAFAALLRRPMGIGGPLALGAAVHVFVGMIEAPLLIRPYLASLSRGELHALMACGLAGVAGTVMVLYATILGPVLPDALAQIVTASIISTPAALAVAALMVPFGPGTADATIDTRPAAGTIDALVRGTADGMGPLVGIATNLIVAVALVTLVNAALQPLGTTLQALAAIPFRPVMWLIGIPWAETGAAAQLMGTKTILNEFVAYLDLAALPDTALSPHSRRILVYALCGFANLGSLGILVGGLGAMLPDRRAEIAALGPRSVLAGTIATCLSGAVAGILG